jgi:hypothetical protein
MTKVDRLCLRLLRHLEQRGWARVAREHRLEGWRVGEVWELESEWSPQGLRAWLLLRNNWYDDAGLSYVDVCAGPPVGLEADTLAYADLRAGGNRAFAGLLAALEGLRGAPGAEAAARPSPPAWDEKTWQTAAWAGRMLEFARDKLSERKLRLFACACCRRLPHVIDDPRNLAAVEAEEWYADGLVPRREMKKARKAARLHWLTSFEPFDEALQAVEVSRRWEAQARAWELAALLRDVVGNPFRPVALRHRWRVWQDGAAVQLARAIYDGRRFDELPILADALEDAGCADEAVLAHCRGPGEHVRGCWLLDGLLGKG